MNFTAEHTAISTIYTSPDGEILMAVDALPQGMWQVTRPTGEISTRNSRQGAEELAEEFLRGRKP